MSKYEKIQSFFLWWWSIFSFLIVSRIFNFSLTIWLLICLIAVFIGALTIKFTFLFFLNALKLFGNIKLFSLYSFLIWDHDWIGAIRHFTVTAWHPQILSTGCLFIDLLVFPSYLFRFSNIFETVSNSLLQLLLIILFSIYLRNLFTRGSVSRFFSYWKSLRAFLKCRRFGNIVFVWRLIRVFRLLAYFFFEVYL